MLIILTVSLFCTGLIRLVRTKHNVINIILGLVILIILNGLSSYITVFAFSRNYFLELHEMTVGVVKHPAARVRGFRADLNGGGGGRLRRRALGLRERLRQLAVVVEQW